MMTWIIFSIEKVEMMSFFLYMGKNVLLYWKILTRIFFVPKKQLGNVIYYVIIFLKQKRKEGKEGRRNFACGFLLSPFFRAFSLVT